MTMGRLAFGCIEEQTDGRRVCLQAVRIAGRFCPVEVKEGQAFYPKTTFGGFDDFTRHLASVCVAPPPV
jgi:hypothetical protein